MDLFDTPSAVEIKDDLLAGIAAEEPSFPRGPGSLLNAEYGGIAREMAELHAHMEVLQRSVTPLDADEAGLTAWSRALALPRKAGVQAGALQALRFTSSTPLTAVPAGTTMQSGDSVGFETTAAGVVAADGTVVLDVLASQPGESGNLAAGERLTLDVGIPGLAASGVLIRDLVGGADQETLGAWALRLLSVWREKRTGGSRADYEQWALELDWVDRVFVYPRKPTIASVGVAALRAGENQLPTTGQQAELLALLNNRRPITDDVFLITMLTRRVDVEVEVTLLPGTVANWTRPVGGLTIASYDSVTRTITTNEALPSDLAAGDLATVVEGVSSSAATGEPVRVAAVTGSNTFVVAPLTDATSEPIPWTVVGGEAIYPSSPELAAIRLAVLNGVTSCADLQLPGIRSYGPANPDRTYGPWQSDYVPACIEALASVQPTVTAATATLGGSGVAVEFSFPNDTTVELLIPGEVWVRT